LESPALCCETVEREWHSGLSGSEIRVEAEARRSVRHEAVVTESLSAQSRWLSPGQKTLITGGGKGLGAQLALRLSASSGARILLLGRSSASDPEVSETLRLLEERRRHNSFDYEYVSVDLLDLEQLSQALHRCSVRWGGFDAVVHAAGVIEDQPWVDKTAASFSRVFAGKVLGLQNLQTIFNSLGGSLPRDWALFSSFSARRGNPKQVDYASANEAMRAIGECIARETSRSTVQVFDWGAWADTGMAVKSGLAQFLEAAGEPLIPVDRGVDLLLRRFSASASGFGELLVLPSLEKAVPVEPLFPGLISSSWRSSRRSLERSQGGGLQAEYCLTMERDRWLREHTIFDDPLMPAVFGIEFLA